MGTLAARRLAHRAWCSPRCWRRSSGWSSPAHAAAARPLPRAGHARVRRRRWTLCSSTRPRHRWRARRCPARTCSASRPPTAPTSCLHRRLRRGGRRRARPAPRAVRPPPRRHRRLARPPARRSGSTSTGPSCTVFALSAAHGRPRRGALYGGGRPARSAVTTSSCCRASCCCCSPAIGGINTVSGALSSAACSRVPRSPAARHGLAQHRSSSLTGLGAMRSAATPTASAAHLRGRGSPAVAADLFRARPAPAGGVDALVRGRRPDEPCRCCRSTRSTSGSAGSRALDDVDLDADAGHDHRADRPERRRQDDAVQRHHRPRAADRRPRHARRRRRSRRSPPHRRARLGMARTFQRLEVFGSLSARENVLVAAEIRKSWAERRQADPRQAVPRRSSSGSASADVANDRVDSLPTGLARLVELGRALATRPRLLLLDEPGSGLDHEETEALRRAPARAGRRTASASCSSSTTSSSSCGCASGSTCSTSAGSSPSARRGEIQADPAVQAAYLGADDDSRRRVECSTWHDDAGARAARRPRRVRPHRGRCTACRPRRARRQRVRAARAERRRQDHDAAR